MAETPYELFYWPTLPGRGEFVRLVFEDAQVRYVDRARQSPDQGGGFPSIVAFMRGMETGDAPYAPPILRFGDLVIAQTAVICRFIGLRHGRAPSDEPGDLRAQQLQLTIADLVTEAHNTHHPLGIALYYEDQKEAAVSAAANFLRHRLPGYLAYFDRALHDNGGRVMVGNDVSYVDLTMFQTLTGLEYAFPRSYAVAIEDVPRLAELRARMMERPALAAYLSSPRRIAFNEDGIFRRYPELDQPEVIGEGE